MAPRPNPTRTIGSERSLAARIAHERKVRDWTYERLATRMTQVGCKIQPSALQKIEVGDPPRRITVDELVALANVFELSLIEILIPVDRVLSKHAGNLVHSWAVAQSTLADARSEADSAWGQLKDFVAANPDHLSSVSAALGDVARDLEHRKPDESVAYWRYELTGDPVDEKRWLALAKRPK